MNWKQNFFWLIWEWESTWNGKWVQNPARSCGATVSSHAPDHFPCLSGGWQAICTHLVCWETSGREGTQPFTVLLDIGIEWWSCLLLWEKGWPMWQGLCSRMKGAPGPQSLPNAERYTYCMWGRKQQWHLSTDPVPPSLCPTGYPLPYPILLLLSVNRWYTLSVAVVVEPPAYDTCISNSLVHVSVRVWVNLAVGRESLSDFVGRILWTQSLYCCGFCVVYNWYGCVTCLQFPVLCQRFLRLPHVLSLSKWPNRQYRIAGGESFCGVCTEAISPYNSTICLMWPPRTLLFLKGSYECATDPLLKVNSWLKQALWLWPGIPIGLCGQLGKVQTGFATQMEMVYLECSSLARSILILPLGSYPFWGKFILHSTTWTKVTAGSRFTDSWA